VGFHSCYKLADRDNLHYQTAASARLHTLRNSVGGNQMVMIMVCICISFKNMLTIRKLRLYNKVTTNSVTYADFNRLLRNLFLRTIHDYLMGFQSIMRRSSGLLHIFSVRRVKSPYFAVRSVFGADPCIPSSALT
jgi:hypothetical protein